MQKFLQHPWIHPVWTFIQNHPLLWFFLFLFLIILMGLSWLANIVPQIDLLWAKILMPIVRKYKQKKLVKSAIKSDIRGHVNREIYKMKDYLPVGWAGEMDVDWVENEALTSFLDDKRTVIRIRPVENQDHNFVNATYHYLRSSFFPKTQNVIPKSHYEASVLYVCRTISNNRSDSTRITFEDQILEPAIQRYSQIPNHLDDYGHLDKRGFFTGTFIRELHLMANDARFTGARNNMTEETVNVIKHIKAFISGYDKHEMIPTSWYNNGSISKYAILLVAHPVKTQNGVDAYINRARNQFQSGAKRLYVFGSNNERHFANAVISGIEETIDGVALVEKFSTPFDYRGERDGVGAVFEYN